MLNVKEINQKLYLINAERVGWIPPDCVESLDEMVCSAERWMARWGDNAAHFNNEVSYE